MTRDAIDLLGHLAFRRVAVLGWSDGGIEALLLGMRHPAKVRKIVAMAATLNPTDEAVYPAIITSTKSMMDAIPASVRQTRQGKRELKVTQMLFDEPHITPAALQVITAPTLVIIGDHDLVREEHALAIYRHVPNSQLCILPDATHMVPYDDPALFNLVVERFLRSPYTKRDRIKDFFKSYEAMKSSNGEAKPDR